MDKTTNFQPIKKRRVFYLPGFDPHPPRRYRELYRQELAKAAENGGYNAKIEAARRAKREYGWSTTAQFDDQTTVTDYDILYWSDIVQKSVSLSVVQTLILLGQTTWVYTTSLSIFRLMRVKREPIVVALYPVFMLMIEMLAAILWGVIVGFVAAQFLPFPAALLLSALAVIGVATWLKRLDRHIHAYFLMSDYGFSSKFNGANPPDLDARIDEFAARLEKAANGDYDELLVVGHSSGAHIGVNLVAKLLRDNPKLKSKISLLTLGQVIPMISFLPDAQNMRRDLYELSISERLFWLDVTAPTDHCCFALTDPVALAGQASRDQKWPIVISAAFSRTMSKQRYEELRRKYFTLHFQYLCHLDYPEDYDYFKITAGPMALDQRFKDTVSSPSVQRGPQSMYRDRAS